MTQWGFGMSVVLVVACLLTLASASYNEWADFKQKYNKTYENDDIELYRYAQWRRNKGIVSLHNERASKGKHSYWMAINQFSDMTDGEFERTMNGLMVDMSGDMDNLTSSSHETLVYLPEYVDWRTSGCVTRVKNQGVCGSCYAFSTTGSLEAQHCLKTGRLVSLSEQNIIDCTDNDKYHDHGCHGGLMDHAFRYVMDNGGIDSEASYPYESWVGKCRFSRANVAATCRGYHDIRPRGDESLLQAAVAKVGPVSIGIDARHGLRHYHYGVYESDYCSSRHLNHGLLVVGYGTQSTHEYWLVKNSWGEWWGDDGYFKMARNRNNMCGVATLASYPIV